MLWVKAIHLIFIVTWFAGLFYLPRLFVYHAMADDRLSLERFKTMERKLLYGIMTPSAILAIASGLWMLFGYAWALYGTMIWLPLKLAIVALLVAYHGYCVWLVREFKHDRNRHSHIFYRWLNELPVLALVAIVILAVVKPL